MSEHTYHEFGFRPSTDFPQRKLIAKYKPFSRKSGAADTIQRHTKGFILTDHEGKYYLEEWCRRIKQCGYKKVTWLADAEYRKYQVNGDIFPIEESDNLVDKLFQEKVKFDGSGMLCAFCGVDIQPGQADLAFLNRFYCGNCSKGIVNDPNREVSRLYKAGKLPKLIEIPELIYS